MNGGLLAEGLAGLVAAAAWQSLSAEHVPFLPLAIAYLLGANAWRAGRTVAALGRAAWVRGRAAYNALGAERGDHGDGRRARCGGADLR